MKLEDVTYSRVAFAAIEIKGVIFFVTAEIAKTVKSKLTEQLMHSSVEEQVLDTLVDLSEFVIDMNTGTVLKPKVD